MITLSTEQQHILDAILEWYKKDREAMQFVTLGGFAGTGKTTLIAVLRRELERLYPNIKVGFAAYTGKAARVLENKIREEQVKFKQDSVGTIHSLIYTPMVNDREEIVGWKTKEEIEPDLIIIDEASMVDGMIWNHLCSYKKPMIVVGDHGQLPPIAGSFNLMQKPILTLETIHRQAAENPIIALSIAVRETGEIEAKKYSSHVRKYQRDDELIGEAMNELLNNFNKNTLILCGYNTTRKRLNAAIRNNLGFESPEPSSGDRVICLRNNHKKRIYNGQLGTIISIRRANPQWYTAEIAMDGDEKHFEGQISVEQFTADSAMNFTNDRKKTIDGDLFDFGYALTVHKAQGSQAKRVILFEERFKQMSDDEWKRWLYTAVTRAEEELYMF